MNKKLELSKSIVYKIDNNPYVSDYEPVERIATVKKIKEMPYDKKVDFLNLLLNDKDVQCLKCKKGTYIGENIEINDPNGNYKWFHCTNCKNSFIIRFDDNFITGVLDFFVHKTYMESYEDLMINNNRDDFFGLDFKNIVYPKLHFLQVRNPGFMSITAKGKFRVENNVLVFDMIGVDEKIDTLIIGEKGLDGLADKLFDNVENIRAKTLQIGDHMSMVMALSNGDEEEVETELGKTISLAYMDYRNIQTKKDMTRLLEESDYKLKELRENFDIYDILNLE